MLPDVILANLNHFFTGVTATLENLYPLQEKKVSLGLHGYNISCKTRKVSLLDILRYGRTPPKDKPFRIYHARRAVDLRRGLFLRDFCKIKIKVIFTSVKQKPHSFPLRRMISRSDGVIALTKEAAALRPKVLEIIPHGVDLKRFSNLPRQSWHDFASQQGLGENFAKNLADKNIRAIGQIGNIRRAKGSHIFVRALCNVLPEFPDAIGVIAGRWIVKDAPLVYRLKRMTRRAGVENRVLWMGLTSYSDMPKLMRALDIYVSASFEEGFSMAMLEALACGTPILATTVGGAAAVIEDGKNGFSVPPNDARALELALRCFLTMRNARESLGLACRARAEELFSIEREAEAIVRVYEKLWARGV